MYASRGVTEHDAFWPFVKESVELAVALHDAIVPLSVAPRLVAAKEPVPAIGVGVTDLDGDAAAVEEVLKIARSQNDSLRAIILLVATHPTVLG